VGSRYGNQSVKVEPWPDQWEKGVRLRLGKREQGSQWEKGCPQRGFEILSSQAGINLLSLVQPRFYID
jgi:hypothetical protein